MGLPAHAPEYRLVGGLLDEGVLKPVDGPRRLPALIQQLRRDKRGQVALQRRVLQGRDGAQQGVGKLAPERGAQLRHPFGTPQPVEPGHERLVQRGRNGECRQRTAPRAPGPGPR